jgi:hypothetical protein
MELANEQEVATFYVMRPEWFDTDQEREAFAAQHPDLVEKFADCWEQSSKQEVAA